MMFHGFLRLAFVAAMAFGFVGVDVARALTIELNDVAADRIERQRAAAVGVLPDWLAILVVFRDLVIVGGIMLMWQLSMPVRIRPMLISKLNTALQLLLVGVVLMLEGFGLGAPGLRGVLVTLVAASTLLSGGLYVWKASRGAAGA